ncbi:uncharacterized protein LOC111370801 [Olea europaea var. sylvestris]|uniref:uncharacterized protein LOC111370801 n=1 Tax=Olea europaea var. sylvestris TaxID=158386 RepID=UPI000C1D892C|nr:uncharacterized protein LOC111370801 [Olea europaea var. sylvestris]
METSFVSKARTAFHSAAAKAEKVFTDIKKSDFITHREDIDKQSPIESRPEYTKDGDESKSCQELTNQRSRPAPIKTKQDWHERLRNIRIGKKGAEDTEKTENSTMAYAIFDENLYFMREREISESEDSKVGVALEGSNAVNSDIIPSSAVVRQLAVAIDAGLVYNSMKDLLASSRGSSPIRERASLSFSAMKSIVLREKEDRIASEFGADERVLSLINSLLNAGHFLGRTCSSLEEDTNTASLIKDIHGAPIEGFVVKLAEAVGCLKTLQKMASFWCRVVAELRRRWSERQYIPGIPPDEIPDLNSCLLHQQLQVINCCISRKIRWFAASESLESVVGQSSSNIESSCSEGTVPIVTRMYAMTKSGELVLRLGADKECDNLTMLETSEPIYTPVTQELPLLTEDLIKETEDFVLRTGSVGAGCSQLLSDMQAFKAANPGCILEDFVRWHSPPDWMENETNTEVNETSDGGDLLSVKGQLSRRMKKEGNLWRELWETAKPVPAVRQTPLYDEDLAVDGILDFLEDISPSHLLKQLFIAALGAGLVIAEANLSTDSSLSKLFHECRNYIVQSCQMGTWVEKLDDICQVYDSVETMLLNPDEVIKMTAQSEETTTAGDIRNRFKRLSLIFGGKSKHSSKAPSKDSKNNDRQPFSSIFSEKPPKPSASPADKPSSSVENDWTIV